MWGIIWLASYPKSGNTWLRAFLANYFRNPDQPIPINDLPKYVLGDNFVTHYQRHGGKTPDELTAADIALLRAKVHEWFASARGETAFVKTHSMIALADGQPLITPSATAAAIYVVRNPLDVAVSYAHHHGTTLDQTVAALCQENLVLPAAGKLLPQVVGSWSQHVRTWTQAPGLRLHVLRFEDMLATPQETFAGVVRFLGLPGDPARLDKALRFSSFRELRRQEAATGFVEARPDGGAEFFRAGKTGNWADVLSADQVERLVACHREVMIDFGYLAPDGGLRV